MMFSSWKSAEIPVLQLYSVFIELELNSSYWRERQQLILNSLSKYCGVGGEGEGKYLGRS